MSQHFVNRLSPVPPNTSIAIDGGAFRGPWFDVTHPDFGAKGNGTTDDRPAIAAADAAAVTANGYVFFPPTTTNYKIGSNITLASPVVLPPRAILAPSGGVTVTINGALTAGMYQVFGGAGSVVLGDGSVERVNVLWWGATRYGVGGSFATASDAAFNAAITSAIAMATRRIYVPGAYRINATLQWSANGLRWEGDGGGIRYPTNGGSGVYYYGTGALFQIGTSKIGGSPLFDASYENADYDGFQFTKFTGLYLKHNAADTALANGQQSYKAGSIAIQDWRGGNVYTDDVAMENFDYPFWGIQSDFDNFRNTTWLYAHSGWYMGPRSDQSHFENCQATLCDTAVWLERCSAPRLSGINIVGCGATAIPAVKINSRYSSGSTDVLFDQAPWFERQQGFVGTVGAYIEIGKGATVTEGKVTILDPFLNFTNSSTVTQYFIEADHASEVFVERVTGNYNLLVQDVKFSGSGSPIVHYTTANADLNEPRWDLSTSTGTPALLAHEHRLQVRSQKNSNQTFTINDAGLTPVTCAGGNITITLPLASKFPNRPLIIKRADASANTLTVTCAGADTIDNLGASTTIAAWGVLRLIPNYPNTAWLSI